jgi:hypothetical protein
MTQNLFPAMPLADWRDTRDTLAQYARVLGKVRRAVTPPQKHWWHVSLHVTAVGLTTTPLWSNGRMWEMVLNLATHQTQITTSDGQQQTIALTGQSAAMYGGQLKAALQTLALPTDVVEGDYADTAGVCDPTAVARYWQALTQITAVFATFKHSFRRESSPVQLWPHHFDLALLWLSGRLAPDQDPNDPEYADEQMNFGFVTGDEAIPEPYFYATAYPAPDGFAAQPLPEPAYWHTAGWTGAILPYQALVTAVNPQQTLLNFLQTAHQAGASLMGPYSLGVL